MPSRWFRALVAVEVLGLVALLVVGLHLGLQAAHAVGDISGWNKPPATATQTPSSSLPTAVPQPGGRGPTPALTGPPGGLFDALNRDAGRSAAVQQQTVLELERAIRDQILAALAQAGGR